MGDRAHPRVLEVSGLEDAAAWCGKLFVRAGAELVKAEPPQRPAPDPADDLYLNGGKRRVAVAVDDPRLPELAAGFDVVVTDAAAADVDRLGLMELPSPVVVSITPFGLSGPYRDWKATEATLLALAGYTHLMGDPDRAPLTMPGRYPFYQAGNFAFVAAAAAMLSGAGARIELSVLECLATLHQFTDTMWTAGGRVRSRHGNRWQNLHPVNMLPCADGWFSLNILDSFWLPFAFMIDRGDLAEDHPWTSNVNRYREADEVDRVILQQIGTWPKEKILAEGQATWRVPVGYLQSVKDLLDDEHLAARGFWQTVGSVKVPGAPYRISGRVASEQPPPSAAPAAGQRLVGRAERAAAPAEGSRPAPRNRPLEGIRVLELTHFWSGPLCGRLLADLGADVVLVEAHDARGAFPEWVERHPDLDAVPAGRHPWNAQPLFTKLNRNKRSLAMNLKTVAGRELFLRLADVADVVVENFSARALPSLGLGHDVLRRRNPRLVYVGMPGYGLSGPNRDYVALGPSTEPMTGLTALMGYSDSEPRVTSKAILDPMSGMLTAVAVLHALMKREQTGEGALVEVSQHECGIAYVGEHLIRSQLEGAEPQRIGNAHPVYVPHGVYRCAGDDEWVAIAVRDEDEWQALAAYAGRGWEHDHRFAGIAARHRHRSGLDEAVEAFTRGHDKRQLASALQAAGVAAAAVLSAPEWLSDPHLETRGYFCELADADGGPRRGDGLPMLVDGVRDYSAFRRAPTLGEHNAVVLRELLGLSDRRIATLATERVIATRPT